jgi:GT2 family glycosyltransferase
MTEKSDRPSLSVITISWNHEDEIAEYLRAIEETQRGCDFAIEMVLVDNASRDRTVEIVERDFPWVKLIKNDRNLGFAAGCNVGLEAATGTHVLLFNPDARANVKAFTAMMAFLRKHPDVGCVGCTLLHEDGLPQQSAFAEMSPRSYITNHSMLYPVREKLRKVLWKLGLARRTKPYNVGWMQGSCLMVPRAVVDKVGGLEPSFFIYCEDTDWCHRIRAAEFKMVHLPNVAIRHRQMGSVKHKPEWCFRRVYRSIVHYTNRHYSGARRRAIFRAMLWDMRLRIPVYGLLSLARPHARARYQERIASVKQLIKIIHAGDPDIFDDPPPR